MNKAFLYLVFIVFYFQNFAQLTLKGKIIDAKDGVNLPFVSVILYEYQSNKIITYAQADSDGNYEILLDKKLTVLTLKARNLGYHLFSKDIIIGSEKQGIIKLDISMIPDIKSLEEVTITGPIIVKDDTVIYDVEHWAESKDDILEDVLAKIPGFKIRGDGEIEVNGKQVNKVLIDGEEITDTGVGLITRSISAEDVKKVEVRFDEKDQKLKESLLDTKEYVVLDIKLKDELKKSFFGKIRATIGYQNKMEIGGYLNAFSLKKKTKIHLFGEHDKFGEQTISLNQIKNIGEEALNKLFETPADFNELTKREKYNEELYGFKNYTFSAKDILGLSLRKDISPSFNVFFGSYNSFSDFRKQNNNTQQFDATINEYQLENSNEDFSSKNKLDFRFDKKNTKIRLDVNAVYGKNKIGEKANFPSHLFLHFNSKNTEKSIYENLLFQQKLNKKFDFELKVSHGYNDIGKDNLLKKISNDSINQMLMTKSNIVLTNAMFQFRSKIGFIRAGVLNEWKNAKNTNEKVEKFSSNLYFITPSIFTNKLEPYMQYVGNLGSLSINSKMGYGFLKFPNQRYEISQKQILTYSLSVDYNFGGFDDISVQVSKNITRFPLKSRFIGEEWNSFQSYLTASNQSLVPKPEYVFSISSTKRFNKIKLMFEPAILAGKIFSGSQNIFENGVVREEYSQNKSEYLIFTSPITKDFSKIPLKIIFEPEWMTNQSENFNTSSNKYNVRTERALIGLKLFSDFDTKSVNLMLYPKYSLFKFANTQTNKKAIQKMLSLNAKIGLGLIEDKLFFETSSRMVKFDGEFSSFYTNIDAKLFGNIRKIRWFLVVSNILNDRQFVMQTIHPNYFISQISSVYGRFFKIGLAYKFK